jgi:hypothetical protein
MFSFYFEIDDVLINANNDATKYSRIFIEFPTLDSQNVALFANNLGGYTKTGEYVGCYFSYVNAYYVAAAVSNNKLKCRLILSEVSGDPVRV